MNPISGKVCIVTGATAGIGEVTARELARQGACVVLVSRSPERCAATAARIQTETGNPAVEYIPADLSVQAAIHRLAEEFIQRHERLDVLVNNAGAWFTRRQESADGIEMTFALNHLSYFLLTLLLLDRLKDSAPARVVNVSSDAHRGAKIDFSDLQGQRRYNGFRAYSQSKLANILFTKELARRLEGSGVTANALHPGFVASRLGMNNGWLVSLGLRLVYRFFALSPEEGARTSVYLASSPQVEGVSGEYFVRQRPAQPAPAARDETTAQRLWQVSAQMTGVQGEVG